MDENSHDIVADIKHQLDRNCTLQNIRTYAMEQECNPLPLSSDDILELAKRDNKPLSKAKVKAAYEAHDNGEDVKEYLESSGTRERSRQESSDDNFGRNVADPNDAYKQISLITTQAISNPDDYSIDKDVITGLISELQQLLDIIDKDDDAIPMQNQTALALAQL